MAAVANLAGGRKGAILDEASLSRFRKGRDALPGGGKRRRTPLEMRRRTQGPKRPVAVSADTHSCSGSGVAGCQNRRGGLSGGGQNDKSES